MKPYSASIFLVFLLMIGWEIGARIVDLPFILPTPTAILVKLWELKTTLLFEHLPSTFLIILIGLSISIVLGIGLAIWMYQK